MYRFGDGTPFPLRENFLDTLTAVVDAAADLYRADALCDEGHRRAREARRIAADELRRIEALSTLVHSTLAPLQPSAGSPRESERAAAHILELTRETLAASRVAVVNARDEANRVALEDRHREQVHAALSTLFLRYTLPTSRWTVEWSAREAAATLLLALEATDSLLVELGGSVPVGDRFTSPIRVADFCPAIVGLKIYDVNSERRKPSWRLGELAILELDVSPHGVRLVLGRANKRTPLIVVARREGEPPVASFLDRAGDLETRVRLDAGATDALDQLCEAGLACLPELIGRRSQLIGASMHGVTLAELEHPAVLADELLTAVAPLVREIRLRSRVPGELILKRDLEGDRREELFVPRSLLTARFADLADQHRRAFEAIGLGDEATLEFRARVVRAAGPLREERFAGERPDPAPRAPVRRAS